MNGVMLDAQILTPQSASIIERLGLFSFLILLLGGLFWKYGAKMIDAYNSRTAAMNAGSASQKEATEAMKLHSVALTAFAADTKAHMAKDDELLQVFRDAMSRVEALAAKANENSEESVRMITGLCTDMDTIKWLLRRYGLVIEPTSKMEHEKKKEEKNHETDI